MKKIFIIILLFVPLLLHSQNEESPAFSQANRGYFNLLSYGQYIGSTDDNKTTITSVQMEHNYRLNNQVALGLVTGVEWYDVLLCPVGFNFKWMIPGNNKTTYFAGGSFGYSIPLEEMKMDQFAVTDTQGGRFAGAELGVLFPVGGKTGFFAALGYRYQSFMFVREDWIFREVEREITYNRLSVRLGLKLF